jgi:pilus assembly protein Flp/PilA
MALIKSLLFDRSGASAAEYAIILAVVGTGIGFAAALLSDSIAGAINDASTCISTPASC